MAPSEFTEPQFDPKNPMSNVWVNAGVLWVLGPSAWATYLRVARHWGSLLVYSDAHSRVGMAAE